MFLNRVCGAVFLFFFCLFLVFLLETNCKKQDSCWRVRGCWQKTMVESHREFRFMKVWDWNSLKLSLKRQVTNLIIWWWRKSKVFWGTTCSSSGFCCFLNETVQRFLQWKKIQVVVSSTSIPLKRCKLYPQQKHIWFMRSLRGVTAGLPDIWSTFFTKIFLSARRGWLMWRQRTGKLVVVSLSDGKGCAKGRDILMIHEAWYWKLHIFAPLWFFLFNFMPSTMSGFFNQVWLVVVVGRLALFFSQLPTADTPPLASWFVVFYVGFFRFFFPLVTSSWFSV